MEGLVSTTWWPSLTMHSHSMPYCRQYPGIYHCDWGEGAQLGSSGGRESSMPSGGEGFGEFSVPGLKDTAWHFSAGEHFSLCSVPFPWVSCMYTFYRTW